MESKDQGKQGKERGERIHSWISSRNLSRRRDTHVAICASFDTVCRSRRKQVLPNTIWHHTAIMLITTTALALGLSEQRIICQRI